MLYQRWAETFKRWIKFRNTLELSCDQPPPQEGELNPEAVPFWPRRAAAAVTAENIKIIVEQDL